MPSLSAAMCGNGVVTAVHRLAQVKSAAASVFEALLSIASLAPWPTCWRVQMVAVHTLGLFLAAALSHGFGACLPEAIPEESRQNVTNLDGESYPLGVLSQGFKVGELTSALARILLEEVLGYRTDAFTIWGARQTMYALAGCEEPYVTASCFGNATRKHLTLSLIDGDLHEQDTALAGKVPKQLGALGMWRSTTLCMHKDAVDDALAAEGLPLRYYESWNASWNQPGRYFDNYTAIPTNHLQPCATSFLGNPGFMARYVRISGDAQGLHPNGTAQCPDFYWFLAPSCRMEPSACVPVIGGIAPAGQDIMQILQKSAVWNMPLAIASTVGALGSPGWEIPRHHRVLWFCGSDMRLFDGIQRELLQFPPHNAVAWRNGDVTSMLEGFSNMKWVSHDLGFLVPAAEFLVNKIDVSAQDVDDALDDFAQIAARGDSGDPWFEAACNWLLGNRGVWASWIPDETQCWPGFGLYDASTGEFQVDRSDPRNLRCKACESGRYSAEIRDALGQTFVCTPCAPGSSQPSGAATLCTPCPLGEYQNSSGSRACKRCGIGKYQNQRGSLTCKKCSTGTTTVGLGSMLEVECGCTQGHIETGRREGAATCEACPDGVHCPVLSSLTGLQVGESDLGEDFVPAILPGFMSSAEEPMATFKCGGPASCPGGRPGTCGGGRRGVACSECGQYQHWNGEQCIECEDWVTVGWVLAIVILFVGLALIQLVGGRARWEKSVTMEMLVLAFSSTLDLGGNLLQTLAIIGQMPLEWPQFLLDGFALLEVFALELTDLGISCLTGSDTLVQFMLQALFLPSVLLWAAFFGFLHKLRLRAHFDSAQLLMNLGQIVVACFAAACNLSLVPFMCYKHPNGKSSNLLMLSILCETGQHDAMILAGTCLGSILIAFWAVCVWVLWHLPRWSAEENFYFLRAATFLTDRFRPSSWWFGLPILLRGPLLSLPVTLFTNNPATQVVLMSMALMAYKATLSCTWPWKIPLLNLMDAAVTWSLLLLVLAGSLHLPKMDEAMLQAAAIAGATSAASPALVLSVAALLTSAAAAHYVKTRTEARWLFLDLGKLTPPGELVDALYDLAHAIRSQEKDQDLVLENVMALTTADQRMVAECLTMLSMDVVSGVTAASSIKSSRIRRSTGGQSSRSWRSSDSMLGAEEAPTLNKVAGGAQPLRLEPGEAAEARDDPVHEDDPGEDEHDLVKKYF
ncbi:SVEP1 [Symbiodinium natans]|uniref:SVEP1 protein n=1 Tax=Symbiodinium natans TaxID=878477 RepID=A0A812UT31_9DINO|nr:SVEP1 [Symbiodinium natans]